MNYRGKIKSDVYGFDNRREFFPLDHEGKFDVIGFDFSKISSYAD